jgi:hypothetical protein
MTQAPKCIFENSFLLKQFFLNVISDGGSSFILPFFGSKIQLFFKLMMTSGQESNCIKIESVTQ